MNFLEGILRQENDRLYVDFDTFKIYIPEGKFKTANMYVDKEDYLREFVRRTSMSSPMFPMRKRKMWLSRPLTLAN